MHHLRFLFKTLLLLLLWTTTKDTLTVAGFTPKPSIREYTETTGESRRHFLWTLEQADGWTLSSADDLETHKAWINTNLETYRWTLQNSSNDTSITAWRDGTSLHIEGRFDGKPYRSVHDLADTPWYQTLSLSLRNHLGGGPPDLEFWIIRPDNLELHRLMISKTTEEPVRVEGKKVPAYCIEVRPAGWKAAFWKGEYWFRKDDGDFVRYQGASGPPGWPPTTVELRSSSDNPLAESGGVNRN